MKRICLVLFMLFLTSNFSFSQGNSNNSDSIYTEDLRPEIAKKITLLYMQALNENGEALKDQEKVGYQNYIEAINEKNLSRSDVQSILADGWGNTWSNITSYIYDLEIQNPTSAREIFEEIFANKQNLVEKIGPKSIELLKSNYGLEPNSYEDAAVQNDLNNQQVNKREVEPAATQDQLLERDYTDLFNLFLTMILFFGGIKLFFNYRKLKNNVDKLELDFKSIELKPQAQNVNTNQEGKLRFMLKDLEKIKDELELLKHSDRVIHDSSTNILEEESNPVTLDLSMPNEVIRTFYGRPTQNGTFESLTSQPNQKSIFELKLVNDTTAKFSVCELSEYTLKEVTNYPDNTLFRVCKHENSNQDFRRGIETVKEGTALKNGESWQVSEENKAIIKFY